MPICKYMLTLLSHAMNDRRISKKLIRGMCVGGESEQHAESAEPLQQYPVTAGQLGRLSAA